MTRHPALRAALLIVSIGSFLVGPVPAVQAQGGCVADIRQLEGGARVMTLPEAMQRAGVSGSVASAQLCRSAGGYVYRLRIRDAAGQVKSIEIPAG